MKNRTLLLKRESLTELAAHDLGRIVGGSAGTCYSCVECITSAIADLPDTSDLFTHHSVVDCITAEICK